MTYSLVKGSNNQVSLVLQDVPSWTSLVINIGVGPVVSISRASSTDGINFTGGVLAINPGQLTESLANLEAGTTYPVYVKVISAAYPQGLVFGADPSSPIQFLVADPPVYEAPAPLPSTNTSEELRGFRRSLVEALSSGKSWVRYGEREIRYKSNQDIMQAIQMVDRELQVVGSGGTLTRQYRII